MWIATVDFAKAFDTMRHKALWTALAQFGIEPQYISLLKSLLLNTVLQAALEDDLTRWREKGMGISLGDLRFADKVLLVSASLEQLTSIMCDFKKSTESVGLEIHPDKTNILSNQGTNKGKEVTIDNIKV